jgi:hypothetical protein
LHQFTVGCYHTRLDRSDRLDSGPAVCLGSAIGNVECDLIFSGYAAQMHEICKEQFAQYHYLFASDGESHNFTILTYQDTIFNTIIEYEIHHHRRNSDAGPKDLSFMVSAQGLNQHFSLSRLASLKSGCFGPLAQGLARPLQIATTPCLQLYIQPCFCLSIFLPTSVDLFM